MQLGKCGKSTCALIGIIMKGSLIRGTSTQSHKSWLHTCAKGRAKKGYDTFNAFKKVMVQQEKVMLGIIL